jgi:putative Holliday junction resolvase
VIAQWNREKTLEAVADLVETHKPDRLIMGFPRNMDGTEGPRAALYREFAALVQERTGMEVILWDERRTTIEAHNILSANGKKTKKHKKNVDAVAASLILEGYLRFLG